MHVLASHCSVCSAARVTLALLVPPMCKPLRSTELSGAGAASVCRGEDINGINRKPTENNDCTQCVCARVTICYCAADPVFDRLGDDGQVDKEQKR